MDDALVQSDIAQLQAVSGTAFMLGVGFLLVLWLFSRFLYVCRPNEILVVSGKKTRTASGEDLNFTVIHAGWHWRVPMLQNVGRMDLRLIPIELQVTRVLSDGGIPLDVHAIANVKITSDKDSVQDAVERFLHLPSENIRTAARQTLEGHLRAVIAQLTPERVNQDRIEFANQLLQISEGDFNKMGLHLDTLKILRVEDEAQYLSNLGRTQIANAVRDAENAESQAAQEVAQEEAASRQLAEVAGKDAEIGVVQRKNQMRTIQGQLEGKAQSVEREAVAATDQVRAEAEQELQQVRQSLEQKRLHVEIVLPAEAQRAAAELIAQGQAAPQREQGVAAAEVLRAMTDALVAAGKDAREIFILSQLDALVAQVASKVREVQVGAVHIVDGGDGLALSALSASYPRAVNAVFASLKELTGVDVAGMLSAEVAPVKEEVVG